MRWIALESGCARRQARSVEIERSCSIVPLHHHPVIRIVVVRSEGSRGHGGHRHWDMGVAERVGRAVRDLDDTKGVVSSSLVRGGTVAGT